MLFKDRANNILKAVLSLLGQTQINALSMLCLTINLDENKETNIVIMRKPQTKQNKQKNMKEEPLLYDP